MSGTGMEATAELSWPRPDMAPPWGKGGAEFDPWLEEWPSVPGGGP